MEYFKLVIAVWSLKIVLCLTANVPGGYYTSRYDTLDIDDILNHKRLVYHYAACLLNRGPCPPQALDLKRVLPEALETDCARCTDKQKTLAKGTIQRLQTEYPSTWKELSDFYDPSGDKFRKFLETSSVNNAIGEDDFENNIAGTLKPIQPTPNFVTSEVPTSSPTVVRRISQPTWNPPINDGFQLLGSITEIGQQVIKVGTQVADMFISTVRAFMGN